MKSGACESQVFIYGASGHGKVVADILLACGIEVDGFIDDDPGKRNPVLGLSVLGDGQWLINQAASRQVAVALGIGDNFFRRTVAEKCSSANIRILNAVHPSAAVSSSANLSQGVVVMAQAVVNSDAQIGTGAIINTAAIVEHDCDVGSFAHLSPRVTLGGNVQIAEMSWLGIGSTVLPGIKIGTGSIIGAGATVTRNIGDWVVAVGTPARILKEAVRRL